VPEDDAAVDQVGLESRSIPDSAHAAFQEFLRVNSELREHALAGLDTGREDEDKASALGQR
jgi:hypothetical protein